MSHITPPNSKTWEKIPNDPGMYGVLSKTENYLQKTFHMKPNLTHWLAHLALENLSESPYADWDVPMELEASIIATMMGYVTHPDYIQIVHERCVKIEKTR